MHGALVEGDRVVASKHRVNGVTVLDGVRLGPDTPARRFARGLPAELRGVIYGAWTRFTLDREDPPAISVIYRLARKTVTVDASAPGFPREEDYALVALMAP